MVKREERLHKKRDFVHLKKEGKRYDSKGYSIVVARNGLLLIRFAVSVSKKVGNSVRRNYEKRVCREVFRLNKKWLPTGYDILFIVKEGTSKFEESEKNLHSLLKRAFKSGSKQGEKIRIN